MTPLFQRVFRFVGLVALLAGPVPVYADHLDMVKVIDSDLLKAWIDQGKTMLVIDSRATAEYKERHLPSAVNIPALSMDYYRDRLPKHPDYPLVFYCDGWPECKNSHDATHKAIQWGYRRVYWFRDGIPAWVSQGYPVECPPTGGF